MVDGEEGLLGNPKNIGCPKFGDGKTRLYSLYPAKSDSVFESHDTKTLAEKTGEQGVRSANKRRI